MFVGQTPEPGNNFSIEVDVSVIVMQRKGDENGKTIF